MSLKQLRLAIRIVAALALISAGFIPYAPAYAVPSFLVLLLGVRVLSNAIDRKEYP
jgi:hypothetical protein